MDQESQTQQQEQQQKHEGEGAGQSSADHPSFMFTEQHLEFLNERLKKLSLEEVLKWCYYSLPNLAQVSSFGATGVVIMHVFNKILNIKMPVVFIDTLHHFQETLNYVEELKSEYLLDVTVAKNKHCNSQQEFEELYGSKNMWETNPFKYDHLVKIEPLQRALRELNIESYFSGRRRDQGGKRSSLEILSYDNDSHYLKINPLAYWDYNQVWDYIKENNIPYNPLYDQNYKSIGDYVTTKPSDPNDSGERSGRFFQHKQKTECGIHDYLLRLQEKNNHNITV
eukprot:TRINITY_DN552_c0_g1_i1.p1 TRINITY_DN552_c0_g1~~TRINITY_DN552_c0_g1_i1.p1  ORF type:complete len:282 (-),score=71.96 TRINITY_DN552_c0_g1_i1:261-1106(-)